MYSDSDSRMHRSFAAFRMTKKFVGWPGLRTVPSFARRTGEGACPYVDLIYATGAASLFSFSAW